MGIDHPGNGSDGNPGNENAEKPSAETSWRPPPDRPGSPGQRSRLDSRAAAAAGREDVTEQRDERDDKPPPPAGEKPGVTAQEKPAAGAEKEAADRRARGSETESDDRLRDGRPPTAAQAQDIGPQTEKDPPIAQSDEDAGETDDSIAEDPPDPEQPAPPEEPDADEEPGDASATDTRPESEGKPEDPSESDVWEDFASKPATYELDGRQFGYRTWGEEFDARRASRDAARQHRNEPPVRDEAPAGEQKNAAGTGTDETGAEMLRLDDASDAESETDERDDPESGDAASDADEPEATDQGDAWREHSDTMKAKWADLESEQAPDRPPEESDQAEGSLGEDPSEGTEDLSGDEPGSWRGDGDQYLAYEENYAVGRAFDRVRGQETEVTDELKVGEDEVADAKLIGLEYRLKGEDRFKEKAAEQLAAELREDPTRAAELIPDALRYTYQIPADKYTQGYQEITEKLAGNGYEMVYSRNSWDTQVYKGINTRWKTSDGQLFEVQFHTPESFEAKQLTHGAYERRRNPQVSDLEAEKLDDFQREVSAGIPMPKNVSDIASFRREDY